MVEGWKVHCSQTFNLQTFKHSTEGKMPKIKRIDHIAVVVDDIDAALGFWRDTLGLPLDHVEDVPDQKSLVAFLPTGESEIELVKPTTEDSGVARFLQKRGPGVHHICFEVEDIDQALIELKEKGVKLINETPLSGSGGKRLAFVHPSSANGVLVELYDLGRGGSDSGQVEAHSTLRPAHS
jgi:methylmalonyl-CoA/ethylmalonyl-CoA epimerase